MTRATASLARLIILILTEDNQSQHDLLGDASELFSRKEGGASGERKEFPGVGSGAERAGAVAGGEGIVPANCTG